MIYYGVKQKKEITEYSPPFENSQEALDWYENKGKNLEKMFNRKLILYKKK